MALFANAKTLSAPKAKKVSEVSQYVIAGLSRFAALTAAIKSLGALAEVEETNVKAKMIDQFVASGMARNSKPDNFEGVEELASASCQLKIRSSASVLSDEDVAILKKENIPYNEHTKQEEAFLINPKYTNDMELLSRVEEALANVALPEDFLLKQEKISVNVASPKSIDAIFALKNEEKIRALLPLVTTLAIKPKIEGNFWAILDDITAETAETAE